MTCLNSTASQSCAETQRNAHAETGQSTLTERSRSIAGPEQTISLTHGSGTRRKKKQSNRVAIPKKTQAESDMRPIMWNVAEARFIRMGR